MDERIGNVIRTGATWEFLVNGRDRRTAGIAIGLVLVVAAGALGGAAAVADSLGADGIVWLVLLLVTAIAAIFGVLLVLRTGRWARYGVRIDPVGGTVTAVDRRLGLTLWTQPFEPGKLYLARTRLQIGHPSTELAALCYGAPPQDHVEDEGPLPHKTVLTTGQREPLERIWARVVSTTAG